MTTSYHTTTASKNEVKPGAYADSQAIADLAKWAAVPPRPLLAKGRVTAIFGPKGAGKSVSVQFMAHARALRDTTFGDLGAGPVLYITHEGQGGIPKRLATLERAYGSRPPHSLHVVFGVDDLDGRGRALDRIKTIVQQCKPSLVIVDGSATTFATNDDGCIRHFAEAGRAIADLGPAVVMTILDDYKEWFDADFDEQLRLEKAGRERYGSTRNGAPGLSFEMSATLHTDSGDETAAVYAKDVLMDDSASDDDGDDYRPYVLMVGRN